MIWTLIFIFAVLGMELIQVDLTLSGALKVIKTAARKPFRRPLDHPYNVAASVNFRSLLDASLRLEFTSL